MCSHIYIKALCYRRKLGRKLNLVTTELKKSPAVRLYKFEKYFREFYPLTPTPEKETLHPKRPET